jgi:hypothetical protein
LPKFRLEGEIETDAELPVPERLTDCGLPVALSATETNAERGPAAVGLKVTLIVQVELAASELPQLLERVKSLELVPDKEMLMILSVAFPEFVTETVWAELVEPTD